MDPGRHANRSRAGRHPDFADEFGFGALRCAIDNLNGDNVEWIQFPAGSHHVYLLRLLRHATADERHDRDPQAGHQPADRRPDLQFEGNISYTPDQRFSLKVTNGSVPSQTFFRAETGTGDAPWTVRELVPGGWDLTGLDVHAQRQYRHHRPGDRFGVDRARGRGHGELPVHRRLHPPPGQLFLSKITFGGVGTFPFTVEPQGGGTTLHSSATTTDVGTPVDAVPGPFDLDAGTYLISERLPRQRGGRWRQIAVNCNGRRDTTLRGVSPSKSVTIRAGEGVACVFENRFVPNGSLQVFKQTRGAGGTTGFVISPVADPTREYTQTAVTSGSGDVAQAHGDSTSRLRLGRYVIQETGTVSSDKGRWTLLAAICNNRLRGYGQGRLEVRLTSDQPHVVCRFINGFTPDVDPVPPNPEPTPPTPSPPPPATDLVVTKRALRGSVPFGSIARFRITVHNAGPVAAEQVVVADDPGPNAQLVSAKPSQGGCNERLPLICRLGALDAGASATILVRVRAVGTPTISNLAVVGSATPETRLDNNSTATPSASARRAACCRSAACGARTSSRTWPADPPGSAAHVADRVADAAVPHDDSLSRGGRGLQRRRHCGGGRRRRRERRGGEERGGGDDCGRECDEHRTARARAGHD